MEKRTTDPDRPSLTHPLRPTTEAGSAQKGSLYLLAAALLTVLGITLVAATQVDASGWLRGDDDEASRHERISARAEFATDWILDRVDATDEQSVVIQAIVANSLDRFHALHEASAGSREQLAALLTAQTVEPEALEAFRQEQMKQFDLASIQFTETVTAIAAELTPEQREELLELVQRHHGHRGHGGWRH